ncbi:MAG TPA: cytosine permease [Jatrophihabitantaceae bacterium]|jgi:putative hydroxymethylpyrimidine transporter CytX
MTSTKDRVAAAEVPRTLAEPAPRALGMLDQLGMWGNLGVSLLGFSGALYVLWPTAGAPLYFGAAVLAIVLGTVLGTLGVAVAAVPGAETGSPAMVLLRGVFGAQLSWFPTILNVVQLLGWTTFELVTISTALQEITSGVPRWVFVLIGGVITTALALRPLGWIRVLRRYVTVLVIVALGYLAVQLLRNPLPSLFGHGTWTGFWIAVDTVVAVAVSYVPVAADYSRHSRRVRDAAVGTFAGYSITQILCYGIGLIALLTVAHGDANKVFGAFIAVPLGTLVFAVLAVRELDQSFVDTYSAAVSVQNIGPRLDRRLLAIVVGGLATLLALALNIYDYENFLILLGSVFVPLLGVLVVDYFWISRRQWNLSESAPARWLMLVPWLAGFVAYQLINPGVIGWWSRMWTDLRWFDLQSWMSASILSFLVAAAVTVPIGLTERALAERVDRNARAHPSGGR